MSLTVPDVGKLGCLASLISALLNGALCHLYSNAVSWTAATVLGDLTECAFTGYSAVSLGSWSSPVIDGSDHGASSPAVSTFTLTGGSSGNIYGYYLTDSTGTLLIGGEQLTGAPIGLVVGQSLNLNLTFNDGQL